MFLLDSCAGLVSDKEDLMLAVVSTPLLHSEALLVVEFAPDCHFPVLFVEKPLLPAQRHQKPDDGRYSYTEYRALKFLTK